MFCFKNLENVFDEKKGNSFDWTWKQPEISFEDSQKNIIGFKSLVRGDRTGDRKPKESYLIAKTYDDICSVIRLKIGMCEMMKYECKPYIDYELQIPKDKYLKNKDKYETKKVKLLHKLIKYIKVSCNELGFVVEEDDIFISSSHGYKILKDDSEIYKISFHFVISNGYYFSCPSQAEQLINKIKEHKNYDQDIIGESILDPSVYKESPMRCILNYKFDHDKRELIPIDKEHNTLALDNNDLMNYLITYITKKHQLIKDDDNCVPKKKQAKKPKQEQTEPKEIKEDTKDEQQILDILKKFLTNPTCISNDGHFYQIDYDHKEGCLFGNKTHDSINGYVHIEDNKLFGGCHSPKCKKNKDIFLGNINVVEENHRSLFDKCTVHEFISSYIPDSIDIIEMMCSILNDKDKFKFLMLMSQCGTGKTRSFIKVLSNYILTYIKTHGKEPNILLISTRISYSYDLKQNALNDVEKATNYKFANYKDYEKTPRELKNLKGLIMSLESLHKICCDENKADRMKIYDIVILDESESIMQQIFSDTIKKDKVCNFNNFSKIIKYASKVILMDAYLSNRSIEMINMDDNLSKSIILKNTFVKEDNKKNFILTNNSKEFYNNIKTTLDNGLNTMIILMKLEIEVVQYIREYFKDTEDIDLQKLIESEENYDSQYFSVYNSKMGTKSKEELKNVNLNFLKKRVLITTNTLGAGVNFSELLNNMMEAGIKTSDANYIHFNNIYVIGSSDTYTQNILFQMIHRIRVTRSKDIHMLIPNRVNFNTNEILHTHTECIEKLNTLKNITFNTTEKVVDGELIQDIVIDNFSRMFSYFLMDRENTNSKVFLTCLLKYGLEKHYTFDLTNLKTEKKKIKVLNEHDENEEIEINVKPKQQKPETENKVSLNKLILKAKNITKFHDTEELTFNQTIENEKLGIIIKCNAFHCSIKDKDEITKIYLSNKTKINNTMRSDLKEFEIEKYDNYTDKIFLIRLKFYNSFCKVLDLSTEDKHIKIDEFDNILNNLEFNENELKLLRSEHGKQFNNKYEIIRSILESFNYNFKISSKKVKITKKRDDGTVYASTKPKYEKIDISIDKDVMSICELICRREENNNKVLNECHKDFIPVGAVMVDDDNNDIPIKYNDKFIDLCGNFKKYKFVNKLNKKLF